jgi:hypothetical protein
MIQEVMKGSLNRLVKEAYTLALLETTGDPARMPFTLFMLSHTKRGLILQALVRDYFDKQNGVKDVVPPSRHFAKESDKLENRCH